MSNKIAYSRHVTVMEHNLHHNSGERNSMALVTEAAQKVALRLGYPSLCEHQLEAVLTFVSGKDVFVVVPTRYGNSWSFACLLLVFDQLDASFDRVPSIIVVATPLIALMKDQVNVSL